MFCTQSMHTVFIPPVVWLSRRPEPKAAHFFVGPHKRSFNTSVIQTDPTSSAVIAMLDVDIFLLIVNGH